MSDRTRHNCRVQLYCYSMASPPKPHIITSSPNGQNDRRRIHHSFLAVPTTLNLTSLARLPSLSLHHLRVPLHSTLLNMLSRTGLRAAARVAQRPTQRACFSRSTLRRAEVPQHNGQSVEKLEGVYDNAFNRERLAVKEHAAATAGESPSRRLGQACADSARLAPRRPRTA